MKIRMTETTRGAPNGINIKTFEAGKEYEVPKVFARQFVKDMGVAVVVKDVPEAEPLRSDPIDRPLKRQKKKKKNAGI